MPDADRPPTSSGRVPPRAVTAASNGLLLRALLRLPFAFALFEYLTSAHVWGSCDSGSCSRRFLFFGVVDTSGATVFAVLLFSLGMALGEIEGWSFLALFKQFGPSEGYLVPLGGIVALAAYLALTGFHLVLAIRVRRGSRGSRTAASVLMAASALAPLALFWLLAPALPDVLHAPTTDKGRFELLLLVVLVAMMMINLATEIGVLVLVNTTANRRYLLERSGEVPRRRSAIAVAAVLGGLLVVGPAYVAIAAVLAPASS